MESNNFLMKALLIEWGLLCCMSQAGACIDDRLNNQLKCRYKCQDGTVIENCSNISPLQTTIHDPIDGYCCPGFLLTSVGKCQVCRDGSYMPDINNCCNCTLCTQCDWIPKNKIIVRCNKTQDNVCNVTKNSTSGNPQIPVCPLIMPTSVDMTTRTALTYNISGNPTGKSSTSGNSQTKLILGIVIPAVLLIAILIISCIYYKLDKRRKHQRNAQNGNCKDHNADEKEVIEL